MTAWSQDLYAQTTPRLHERTVQRSHSSQLLVKGWAFGAAIKYTEGSLEQHKS